MNPQHTISHVIFLIFFGTAILATLALYTRQSLLVAYIILGAILGPWGIKLVTNSEVIKQAGDIGIIFLLFLLGLHLQPQSLYHSLRKMSLITLASSLIFFGCAFLICFMFRFTLQECFIIGIAFMFSSTIIGLKLLPTTILHHQHTGELVVSILLLQDIIAIASLLIIQIVANQAGTMHVLVIVSAFPALIIAAFLFEKFILTPLLEKFDKIQEYIFILSIGWCLLMAEFSHIFGLSEEIGAFIAGVTLGSNPIAFYIAENLKPLRDFFLVLFFFSMGASFDFGFFHQVWLPACVLAGFILILKPIIFSWLLYRSGEVKAVSWEIGVRLGQLSEFSLLVIYLAQGTDLVSSITAYTAQAAIIITFIVSCYWTVMQYPTPLAVTDKLRRD